MTQLPQSAVPQGLAEFDELRRAVVNRSVIAEAVGILMERHGLGDEQAIAYLVRMSRNRNVKLRLVAAGVVADTATALASAPNTQLAGPAPQDEVETPLVSVPSTSGVSRVTDNAPSFDRAEPIVDVERDCQ